VYLANKCLTDLLEPGGIQIEGWIIKRILTASLSSTAKQIA